MSYLYDGNYAELGGVPDLRTGGEVGMTVMKIIDGLYFTIGKILFNPLTGEGKTPDQLNEDDWTTYDACMGAIALLKAQEPKPPIIKENSYGWKFYYCPSCEKKFYQNNKFRFCDKCGQAVKWE